MDAGLEQILGPISLIEKVIQWAKLIHDFREAPAEMESFARTLEVVAVDLRKIQEEREKKWHSLSQYGHLTQVESAMKSTTAALQSVQSKLDHSDGRVMWMFKNKEEVAFLENELKTCHLSLTIAHGYCATLKPTYSIHSYNTLPFSSIRAGKSRQALEPGPSGMDLPHATDAASRSSGNPLPGFDDTSGQKEFVALPGTKFLSPPPSIETATEIPHQKHNDLPTEKFPSGSGKLQTGKKKNWGKEVITYLSSKIEETKAVR